MTDKDIPRDTDPVLPPADSDGDQYIAARREHLDALRKLGIEPYPYRFEPSHSIAEIKSRWDELCPDGKEEAEMPAVRLAGRLTAVRTHGKTAFGDLLDQSDRIQIYLKQDDIGEDTFSIFELLDLGDWVGVEGTLMVTRTGEKTVRVTSFDLLAKTIRPIPTPKTAIDPDTGEEKTFYAFADREARFRRRYVDLFVNPHVRDIFRTRSRLVTEVRSFLNGRGFLEVETPVLQQLHGGASARPFITVHNTLNIEMYLRIALELYHKRLIVGGLDRIYEIGRIFRNEGLDRWHNPEFTMLELYQAYADYNDIMKLVEDIFAHWCESVLDGGTQLEFDGRTIDLALPFQRVPFLDLLSQHGDLDAGGMEEDELRNGVEDGGVDVEGKIGRGGLLDAAFGAFVEPNIIQPVFVIDYPMELSPLAKRHREIPGLTERFELIIAGMEFANAFSELNDPDDQRARFEQQLALLELGDDEAQRMDEDFVRSLEYGMPPTGGLGIGIDRVVMLFTDQRSIRDVILFPTLRPEEGQS